MKSFITYEGLPISSGGGHHLGSKSPRVIYNRVLDFVKSYTDDLGADTAHFELTKFEFGKIIKYSLKFGLPEYDWFQKIIRWRASNNEINRYLTDSIDRQHLRLCILWRFKFVNFVTKEVLPGQTTIPVIDFRQHNSQMYLRLSPTNSTASVWFAFPFEDLAGEHLDYINGIQNKLPFKLSKQHWRLWKLSNNHHWSPQKISF